MDHKPIVGNLDPFVTNKILRFPERIAEWMRTGWTSGPIVVDFDLTNACSHNCPACPGEWRTDPAAAWETDDALDALRQFKDLGCLAVSFGGGGDPLAHPDAATIIERAAALGLSCGVITNGAILREGWADRLTRSCKWIRVSLDAATQETFARVHGVGPQGFNTILDNIRRLAATRAGATIGVGMLTDARAAGEVSPAARLVRSLGADYIQYRPFNYDGYNPEHEIRAAASKWETSDFRVLASWPKYDRMTLSHPEMDSGQGNSGQGYRKPYSVCRAHHFATVVTAQGGLHFCCDMRRPEGRIGDLQERAVGDLWRGEGRKEIEETIDLSKCPPLCRGNDINCLLDKISSPITHEEFL